MRRYIRRYFINPENEERWINEMARKGFGLIGYSLTKYEFEDIIPGEYTYRLYFLEEKPNSKEWQQRLQDLEEMNITCVANYRQWVYLRKTVMNGMIGIHSTKISKLTYLKRQHNIWGTLILVELAIGTCNLVIVLISVINSGFSEQFVVNLVIMLITFALAAIFLCMDYSIHRQIKALEKEEINESN